MSEVERSCRMSLLAAYVEWRLALGLDTDATVLREYIEALGLVGWSVRVG